ncbi:MAG TPA: dTDP-4-dehydrorhamnose reductase [Chitinophagaceae bacterium]|nr:dTDP-4-dehydrorhamnose reductase [Chitinophagaceae bacterium]
MKDKPVILVTGANGQLGKELRDVASSYPQYQFIFLSREDLPIHHFELVRNFFEALRPDFCINCAAYTAVDKAELEKELAFQVNGEAVGVLAAVCKKKSTRFIHISTDYVFDGSATIPYKETSATNPLNIYGASKLDGERQALHFNPDSIIIRSSWIYSSHGKNFVKTMIQLMNERDQLNVVNDQIGSPTYAGDLAIAIMHIVNKCPLSNVACKSGIYHYSNDGVISWYDFASAIKEITGSKCIIHPIASSQYPTPAKRPYYSVLNKEKIIEAFQLSIPYWKDSLKSCIEKIQ